MIGAIYGDVAGSKYEFHNIKTKDFELLTSGCYFTDDTVCTIAFMDWLLHAPIRSGKTATNYLRSWTRRYPGAGYGARFRYWIHSFKPEPYGSIGNGAAMRVSAVAWAAKNLKELKELTYMITDVTHNTNQARKGALVTSTSIFMALHGYSKEEIYKYLVEQYPEVSGYSYERLHKEFRFNETCDMTVPQAIYCFCISESFEDCAKTTISIGGDCDTTAAISCAIAEAYYGVNEHQYKKAMSFLTKEMKDVVEEFTKIYKNLQTAEKY